ncbi:MAG: hypothetical protein EOP33_06405 [Rickettsiaceae bacterium]|nr:MAG: hypothetical protein EOP33_06405 [Rickettsiaceae bacterium]
MSKIVNAEIKKVISNSSSQKIATIVLNNDLEVEKKNKNFRKIVTEPELVVEKKERKVFFFSKVTEIFREKSQISKTVLPNDIIGCSDKDLREIVERHKEGIVPTEYMGTQNEEIFKDFMYNYFIQFRDALQQKDVEFFNDIFVDSLGNKNLYLVSGFPVHVLSSIFSTVVSDNPEYAEIIELSAKKLSNLLDTKNPSNVDTSSIPEKTNMKSFQQAWEILVMKGRSSDINDSNIKYIMTNDQPKSEIHKAKLNGFETRVKATQTNYDCSQNMIEEKITTSKDVKTSGHQNFLSKSAEKAGKKKDVTIYMGPADFEQKNLIKSHHCDAVLQHINNELKKKNITSIDKTKLLKAKHYVTGYRNSNSSEVEHAFERKLDALGYPFKSFVYYDSFDQK